MLSCLGNSVIARDEHDVPPSVQKAFQPTGLPLHRLYLASVHTYASMRCEFAFKDLDGHLVILSEVASDLPTCEEV